MYSTNPTASSKIKSKTEANKTAKDTSLKTSEDTKRETRGTKNRVDNQRGFGRNERLTSFLLCLDHAALFSKYLPHPEGLLYTESNSFPVDSEHAVL